MDRTLLAAIVARSSNLRERLEDGFVPCFDPCFDPPADPEVRARLARWRRAAARDDAGVFARRLALDGLDEAAAARAVASVRIPCDRPLPRWTETLAELIDAVGGCGPGGPGDALRAGSDPPMPGVAVPFAELYPPFLGVAHRRLLRRTGPRADLLSHAAHRDLQRGLLFRLSALLAPTLELEFSIHRARSLSPLERILSAAADPSAAPSRAHYEAFLARLRADGLASLLSEYSVLARLLATTVDQWVDASAELVSRLAADLPELTAILAAGTPQGPIASIAADRSDPHNDGRTVAVLTFESGLEVVYKPKDLGIESAFSGLLSWWQAQGGPPAPRPIRVLERDGYGWVEHIAPGPCGTEREARLYYRRAGALVCLAYLLDATDCHGENLIAHGEHPMLVDAETLLHPQPRPEHEAAGSCPVTLPLWDSVLRSGLLPRWELSPDRQSVLDVSGLGGIDEGPALVREPRWRHLNTDAMAVEHVYLTRKPRGNVPRLVDRPLPPEDFTGELVDGFRDAYRFLLARAAELRAPDSPFARIGRQKVRFIFRMTRAYALLIERARRPENLRDGVERSLELDFLSRRLLDDAEPAALWPILAAERDALERQDVPCFVVPGDSVDLPLGAGTRAAGAFSSPASERALARLARLDEADLARQVELIHGALFARVSARENATSIAGREPVAPDPTGERALTRGELLDEATRLASELARRASRGPDGEAGWVGLEHLLDARRFQLNPIGPSLYDGTGGVALFLSALEASTGGGGYRPLALGALRPFRRLLRSPLGAPPRLVAELGLGGAVGLGSLIYLLSRCGLLLGGAEAEELLDDAERVASAITPADIAGDRQLDVVSGTAGLLLGLLALHATRDGEHVLELARACGRHLLEARSAGEASAPRSWATAEGRHLTGFGHGAAGIAYALLRLHEVAPDPALLEAAEEAVRFERRHFVPEAGNWSDLRVARPPGSPPAFMLGWCSGAPGIGLARLGGLRALDTAAVREDIQAAVDTTSRRSDGDVDHLCCGGMSHVELLISAAAPLGRPDLSLLARRRAARLVSRARLSGGYRLGSAPPGTIFNPGLFQGVAGIGLTLLRLADRDRTPSALLWE